MVRESKVGVRLGHGWGTGHGWGKVGAMLRHGRSKVATISCEIFFQIMK